MGIPGLSAGTLRFPLAGRERNLLSVKRWFLPTHPEDLTWPDDTHISQLDGLRVGGRGAALQPQCTTRTMVSMSRGPANSSVSMGGLKKGAAARPSTGQAFAGIGIPGKFG